MESKGIWELDLCLASKPNLCRGIYNMYNKNWFQKFDKLSKIPFESFPTCINLHKLNMSKLFCTGWDPREIWLFKTSFSGDRNCVTGLNWFWLWGWRLFEREFNSEKLERKITYCLPAPLSPIVWFTLTNNHAPCFH